jgi:retron-type reverse transcriptase
MLCYYKDVLPQGAPTSPAITNILLRNFDETVGAWCEERQIAYTRYCDDMTFSGDFDEKAVIAFVTDELKVIGFTPNKRKTTVVTSGKRQTVTGLVVNEKVSLPADYRRQIRKEVHFCEKYGVEDHLKAIGSPLAPEKYLASLLGRIGYVLQITPDDRTFREYRDTVLRLLRESK